MLTDGEVTNTDAVLALAKQHAAQSRVFTFGIGAGASHHLVRGLARAGGGSAEFIYPGERIERKVVRQFGKLLSSALTDVRLEWGNLSVTQAPTVLPPVFGSGRLLVYGLDASLTPSSTVRLTAKGPAGPLQFDVPVDRSQAVDGRTVATLAARARIRELEESPEWVLSRGSRQRERKATGISREIVDLSIRYGLISRETSFVAIERREAAVTGDIQLRRIPIALTSGWGGLQDEVLSTHFHAARAMPSSPAPAHSSRRWARGAQPRKRSRRDPDVEERASEAAIPVTRSRRPFARAQAVIGGSAAGWDARAHCLAACRWILGADARTLRHHRA